VSKAFLSYIVIFLPFQGKIAYPVMRFGPVSIEPNHPISREPFLAFALNDSLKLKKRKKLRILAPAKNK